jgi:hypothetical protein
MSTTPHHLQETDNELEVGKEGKILHFRTQVPFKSEINLNSVKYRLQMFAVMTTALKVSGSRNQGDVIVLNLPGVDWDNNNDRVLDDTEIHTEFSDVGGSLGVSRRHSLKVLRLRLTLIEYIVMLSDIEKFQTWICIELVHWHCTLN